MKAISGGNEGRAGNRVAALCAGVCVLALVVVASASGALGLKSPSCISDAGSPTVGCATSSPGLLGPQGIAVSPDGKSLYVAGTTDDAIVTFARNTVTGALTTLSCIKDAAPGECGASAPGLDAPTDVVVSPDGASVYAASFADDAIVTFTRNTSTGALSAPSCIEDIERDADCDDIGAAGEAPGLDGVRQIAISPDGKSLYATSLFPDDAIVTFTRNTSTGALSAPSCIKDDVAAECATAAPGLDGPNTIAVSPDGKSVYVASLVDNTIVSFTRDSLTGALSAPSCIKDDVAGECAAAAAGLGGAAGVGVSPGGKSVYVAAITDDAIVTFTRNTLTGELSAPSCIKDGSAGGCGGSAPGLDGAGAVKVSPDGKSLYAASVLDSALVAFTRNTATGALSSPSCIKDDVPGECGTTAHGLDRTNSIALSANGRSVYVTGSYDNAVVTLTRDFIAPQTKITRGPKPRLRIKRGTRARVRFSFSSSDRPSSFRCRLNGGRFRACTSRGRVKLRIGRNTFSVRATDAAGNVDPTPAVRVVRVLIRK